MHFYTLNSQNSSKLYLWEIEEISLNERFKDTLTPLYWFFEEVSKYPTKQVVYARALIPHTRINRYSTNFSTNLERFYITNPCNDLGLVAIENDKWYKVIGDKPIKTFYVRKQDQFCFEHFSREGKLNEFIKYVYRGN